MQKGWETHYFFLSNNKGYEKPVGTFLHPIKRKRVWTKLGDISYPYMWQLWRTLEQTAPDVIYQRCGTALTGVAAYFAQRHKRKLIFHVASDRDVYPKPFAWQKPHSIFEYKMTEYGILHADSIIAQTQYQADILAQNFKKKAIVIPNGHPVPRDCRKKNDKILILWIGNWKPVKRPELFIELAKKIGQMKDTRLTMLGRTDNYDALVATARKNNVNVLGEVDNRKVNELLENAHLLVNTSAHEGFSNTFIQAWMRRVPVLSLQVDPDNLIRNKGIGYCTGSLDSLISTTKELVLDHRKRDLMGKKAREYALRHLTLQNMDRILNVMHIGDR